MADTPLLPIHKRTKGIVYIYVGGCKDLSLITPMGMSEPICELVIGKKKKRIELPRPFEVICKADDVFWGVKVKFTRFMEAAAKGKKRKRSSQSGVGVSLELRVNIIDVDEHNNEYLIGSTSIPLQDLYCGIMQEEWYNLEGGGKVKVGIQPVDFGQLLVPKEEQLDIDLPPPSLKFIKSSEILKTKHLNDDDNIRPLMYIQPKNITRKSKLGNTYSTVYKGKVKGIRETIAIKYINIEDENSVLMWISEVEMMAHNRSRYIVKVHGYCYSSNLLSIIMEYCRLGSLHDIIHIEKLHLSLLHKIRMARHCLRALVWIHGRNVVHRDIKSCNIMVTDDLSCKFSDFGSAKINSSYRTYTMYVGTAMWRAPEANDGVVGFFSDIYSIGVVLYELFLGELPKFNRESDHIELPKQNFNGHELIRECVQEEYEKRPTAITVLNILDKWIFKLLDRLSHEDDSLDMENSSDTQIETNLINLYNRLVHEDPYNVDKLIAEKTNLDAPSATGVKYSTDFFSIEEELLTETSRS
eukprot:TRINITY_DN8095_c0_g1_i1.p1 TRINITY_DN8095_c0_g1~~TRINITY_DN8095_c0_g1_i1.p1  ORF type:complete len:526 (-),score=103.91 TRINITY_DN8095_c0_g1_i1:7-1584(-)